MPGKPSIRSAGESVPAGRRVFYTPEPEPVPAPVRRTTPEDEGESWERNHKRFTFHCPVTLIAAVEAETKRSGRSKSRVIVDALREHLDVDGGR